MCTCACVRARVRFLEETRKRCESCYPLVVLLFSLFTKYFVFIFPCAAVSRIGLDCQVYSLHRTLEPKFAMLYVLARSLVQRLGGLQNTAREDRGAALPRQEPRGVRSLTPLPCTGPAGAVSSEMVAPVCGRWEKRKWETDESRRTSLSAVSFIYLFFISTKKAPALLPRQEILTAEPLLFLTCQLLLVL